jgi:hypothetical protein
MKPLDVVGVAEIAGMFSHPHEDRPMAPESVSRWRKEGTLPVPDVVLASGPVWRRSRIVAWANRTGRKVRYE